MTETASMWSEVGGFVFLMIVPTLALYGLMQLAEKAIAEHQRCRRVLRDAERMREHYVKTAATEPSLPPLCCYPPMPLRWQRPTVTDAVHPAVCDALEEAFHCRCDRCTAALASRRCP